MHIVTQTTRHPALPVSATMSTYELAFFTDAPVAHEVAYRDFQRAQMIERRNVAVLDALRNRDRAHRRARVAALAWGE